MTETLTEAVRAGVRGIYPAEDVPGLDRVNADLVLAAIAHANGSHEGAEMDFDEDGRPTGISALPTLHAWPERA